MDPRYDPAAVLERSYADLVAGCFKKMPREYRIARPSGREDWLVIFTLEGGGMIRRGAREFPIHRQQIVLFQPCIPHEYGTDPEVGHWSLAWAHFHPPGDWLPLLRWPELVPGTLFLDLPRNTKAAQQITDGFKEMVRCAASSLPRRGWLAMNALEGVLLRCDALVSPLAEGIDPRVPALIEYIKNRISEPISLADLCAQAHLSTSQLSNLFRRHLRISPQVYIERQRMEQAAHLLNFPSLSIKEIASRSGYNDPLYFSKRFKKYFGVCPATYRDDLVHRVTL